ncbi:MAG: hypothetical protein ACM31D_11900 [Bacteroidota bacterium]
MEIRTTLLTAAALGLLLSAAPAGAQSAPGILACQIALSQFAEDASAAKASLSDSRLTDIRKFVDLGRSQCRSSPQVVMTETRTARTALRLHDSGRAVAQFSDFWPPTREEMASLQR